MQRARQLLGAGPRTPATAGTNARRGTGEVSGREEPGTEGRRGIMGSEKREGRSNSKMRGWRRISGGAVTGQTLTLNVGGARKKEGAEN